MSVFVFSPQIHFIACEQEVADHFAACAKTLKKKGYQIQIYALDSLISQFNLKNIKVDYPFCLTNFSKEKHEELAQKIVESCKKASIVITGVGHFFDVKLQQVFRMQKDNIPQYVYYDHLKFEGGKYFSIAMEAMKIADGILFANTRLANVTIYKQDAKEVNVRNKRRYGIGYYSFNQITERREEKRIFYRGERQKRRANFLEKNEIKERSQKILAYGYQHQTEEEISSFFSILEQALKQLNFKDLILVIYIDKEKLQDLKKDPYLKNLKEKLNFCLFILSSVSELFADFYLSYQKITKDTEINLEDPFSFKICSTLREETLIKNHLPFKLKKTEDLARYLMATDEELQSTREEIFLKVPRFIEVWEDKLEQAIKESMRI